MADKPKRKTREARLDMRVTDDYKNRVIETANVLDYSQTDFLKRAIEMFVGQLVTQGNRKVARIWNK